MLMAYEVFRDLQLANRTITTPITTMQAPMVAGRKLVLAPILRAGLGLAEGMLDLIPAARVAHIGLYRDHDTLEAVEYYFKAPDRIEERLVALVDPMLATGNSAIAAASRLKAAGATEIRFLCLLAAPEGVARFTEAHPDIPLFTAAIDSHLNENGYIVPGLGDAGDRMFGTK
jgi:uracil phosphoribosyltransferase